MEKIGKVGVDSGQLMICDPCYIDSHWTRKEFNVAYSYEDEAGHILTHGKDFRNYEEKLKQYDNKTVNKLIREGILKEIPHKSTGEFNYDGLCRETLSKEGCGCIRNGLATVFSSGFGDGMYPVYAERNNEGRIIKVVIKMD